MVHLCFYADMDFLWDNITGLVCLIKIHSNGSISSNTSRSRISSISSNSSNSSQGEAMVSEANLRSAARPFTGYLHKILIYSAFTGWPSDARSPNGRYLSSEETINQRWVRKYLHEIYFTSRLVDYFSHLAGYLLYSLYLRKQKKKP